MTAVGASEVLREFLAAENARDWDAYARLLHPEVRWSLQQHCRTQVICGAGAYVAAMKAAYESSGGRFRWLQRVVSGDGALVGAMLEDDQGARSLDVFVIEDGLVREEWEFILGRGPLWQSEQS